MYDTLAAKKLSFKQQVEQSSDHKCVLVHTCTCTNNWIFTCCFVLLLIKCYSEGLITMFHTLNHLYFDQNRRFFMIPTRLWPTDGSTEGHTLL